MLVLSVLTALLVATPLPKLRLPRRENATTSNAPMVVVDRRLRLLVAQQEAWYLANARYGTDVARVARGNSATEASLDLVQIQVLYAGKRGWTAIASHPDAPGRSCVVYVGHREALPLIPRTRADANVANDEGRPACDR